MALKCVILTIVRGVKKCGGCASWGSVPDENLLHSSYRGVVGLYDNIVVGIRGVDPRLKTSVQSHGMK